MVVADPRRFALLAGPGALLGRGQVGVPPQFGGGRRPVVQMFEMVVAEAASPVASPQLRRAAAAQGGVCLQHTVLGGEEVGGVQTRVEGVLLPP